MPTVRTKIKMEFEADFLLEAMRVLFGLKHSVYHSGEFTIENSTNPKFDMDHNKAMMDQLYEELEDAFSRQLTLEEVNILTEKSK